MKHLFSSIFSRIKWLFFRFLFSLFLAKTWFSIFTSDRLRGKRVETLFSGALSRCWQILFWKKIWINDGRVFIFLWKKVLFSWFLGMMMNLDKGFWKPIFLRSCKAAMVVHPIVSVVYYFFIESGSLGNWECRIQNSVGLNISVLEVLVYRCTR